jgi:hypothetical protein
MPAAALDARLSPVIADEVSSVWPGSHISVTRNAFAPRSAAGATTEAPPSFTRSSLKPTKNVPSASGAAGTTTARATATAAPATTARPTTTYTFGICGPVVMVEIIQELLGLCWDYWRYDAIGVLRSSRPASLLGGDSVCCRIGEPHAPSIAGGFARPIAARNPCLAAVARQGSTVKIGSNRPVPPALLTRQRPVVYGIVGTVTVIWVGESTV